MTTSEPVVLHHGREGGRYRSQRGAAGCFNGLLGGVSWAYLDVESTAVSGLGNPNMWR